MPGSSSRWGFTLTETLVVVLVLAFLGSVFVHHMLASRERARRGTCMNQLKQLGLAFHNFHDSLKHFPPAAAVSRGEEGEILSIDGWSFAVRLLPYLEYRGLYDSIDARTGKPLVEPEDAEGTPHAAARATIVPELLCPSDRQPPFAATGTSEDARTNYKVMGATHHASLSVASPEPATPACDPGGRHPDGACYPGSRLSLLAFVKDGSSNTILATETIERLYAGWSIGYEATLVGLPPLIEYVEFAGYHAPKGFDGGFGDRSTVDPLYRTYLDWPYLDLPYDGADGTQAGLYGPSSCHPGVTNHLFVDGGVRSLHNGIDVATYMFLITRSAGDPGLVSTLR